MSDMSHLIDAHRAALSALNAVLAEQNRWEEQGAVMRECEVDLLLAHQVGAGVVTGTSEEELRQKLAATYEDHAVSLLWLHRHSRDLYDDAAELLTHLRDKNMQFVSSAVGAWRQDRKRHEKKESDLAAQWHEANAAETAAAVALLRHPAADREEEAMRTTYIQQTRTITGDFNAYADALLKSFLSTEAAPAYIPNKVYWSFQHGE